jgi:hypothetical protein
MQGPICDEDYRFYLCLSVAVVLLGVITIITQLKAMNECIGTASRLRCQKRPLAPAITFLKENG